MPKTHIKIKFPNSWFHEQVAISTDERVVHFFNVLLSYGIEPICFMPPPNNRGLIGIMALIEADRLDNWGGCTDPNSGFFPYSVIVSMVEQEQDDDTDKSD